MILGAIQDSAGVLVGVLAPLVGVPLTLMTKEEWLRECMRTRRVLEELSAATIRLETSKSQKVETSK
jgi:hypothetical protein